MAASIGRKAFSLFPTNFVKFYDYFAIRTIVPKGPKRWKFAVARQLYKKREQAGPERERHRSEWINWNYDAELFAFGQRLQENFKDDTLRAALTEKSFVEKEAEQLRTLGVVKENEPVPLQHNGELAEQGRHVASRYVKAFLRYHYPALPEEAISAVHGHLMSHGVLHHVANNLGLRDLIRCFEIPVKEETLIHAFLALIGALVKDSGEKTAHLFVQDFILTQLVGKEISELWTVRDPMGLLTRLLKGQGKEAPEARLIRQTGGGTVMAVYHVGVYSSRRLLGQAPGETLLIAEEVAARDALRNVFGTQEWRPPMQFGAKGRQLSFDLDKVNPSIEDYTSGRRSINI